LEEGQNLLLSRPAACQQTVAVKVYVASEQRFLRLEQLSRLRERVEPGTHGGQRRAPSSQYQRQSVTSGLLAKVCGVTEQKAKGRLPVAILLSGRAPGRNAPPVPSEALFLVHPQASEKLVDADDGQRGHVNGWQTFTGKAKHLQNRAAVGPEERLSRTDSCQSPVTLYFTLVGVETKPLTEPFAYQPGGPRAELGEE
jgi:hypothetical protein